MEGSQPGFDGGVGFEQMSAPDDHANQFNQQNIDNYSANEADGNALDDDNNFDDQPSAGTDGIQDNGGSEFWNQDFPGQNSNAAEVNPTSDEPNVLEGNFDS
jgi:hypothetical protein